MTSTSTFETVQGSTHHLTALMANMQFLTRSAASHCPLTGTIAMPETALHFWRDGHPTRTGRCPTQG
jgi:hypothetical protein